jgi:hypothetical protein
MGVAVAMAACVAAAGAQATSPRGSSDNWSGYVTFGTPFKAVRGTWIQPDASCLLQSTSYTNAAFWVGLGGNAAGSYKVEQIGTEADCDSRGRADYYAWYELWPADGHTIYRIEVLPGDLIRAEVDIGRTSVHVDLDDVTGGQSFSKTISMRKPDGTSAEWIAEAPAVTIRHHDQIVPLTNYGTVRFTSASATSRAGHSGSISDHAWRDQAIDFSSDRGNADNAAATFVDATSAAHGFPSELGRGGAAFTITWERGLRPASRSSVPPGAA